MLAQLKGLFTPEAIAASLAHVDDGRATIDPTGVVVLRR